ncbi:hypothetical protein KFL_003970010 [Klebsormidium nitens]|uniref:Uncharacterized protein n=1 Tax=Klebsormidium nitens TaxID=105231 RepID=A0A1Y1IAQ9_KLENI|nr:hypothetical protein KFL_003970010 [Klebsormidium nitens]|eukprot:GAQ88054.1 hypothetical protein KFL_003970010 [Klebsormidium nitens]
MGLAEDGVGMESGQGSPAEEQGFLERCVLVVLGVSSALLVQVRRAPGVGPVVANVEDALLPYAASAEEHLKQHGKPLLTFGDKQLHNLYTLVRSAFPVVSPVLETASSVSDSALSVMSDAAASAKSRGFIATGVTLYDQYKPAATRRGEAAAQYLERFPVVATAVPLMRCVGAKVSGVIDWAVDTGRPKQDSDQSDTPSETPKAEDNIGEEVAPAEKTEVATAVPEITDKDVGMVDEDKSTAHESSPKGSVPGAKELDDVVPVESLFESWTTGTRSRRGSVVGTAVK